MRIARRLGTLALSVAVAAGIGLAAGAPAQAATGTMTQLMVPQAMTVGAQTYIAASVEAASGSSVPTGSVKFATSAGTLIAEVPLTPVEGTSFASASTPFTVPNWTGTTWYDFTATYVPNNPAFSASASAQVGGVAYTYATQVNALVPPKVSLNAPALTYVLVNPQINGTANFLQNGVSLNKPSIAVTNTLTPYVWTPTVQGAISWTVDFTSTDKTVAVYSTVPTFVLPANPANTVTISGAPATGTIGQQVAVSATSASGAAVTLQAGGPCTLSGSTLTLAGAGTCTVTGSAAGGGSYSAGSGSATITVAQGTQTAKVPAPASGKVKVGAALVLSRPSTKTNLGTAVTWKVTKGSSVCSISRKGGTSTLKVKKAGSCTVVGSAAGVAGQWSGFSVKRTYNAS